MPRRKLAHCKANCVIGMLQNRIAEHLGGTESVINMLASSFREKMLLQNIPELDLRENDICSQEDMISSPLNNRLRDSQLRLEYDYIDWSTSSR